VNDGAATRFCQIFAAQASMKIVVIIVTHNSQAVLGRCIAALEQQTVPLYAIALVDSGSEDTSYLQSYHNRAGFTVSLQENIGFSRANNVGYQAVGHDANFVLFLNPDAFPAPDSLELACAFLVENQNVGGIGGRLLGFDSDNGQPTGLLDSTGVFRTWYGRWYDRDQGQIDNSQYSAREDVPAICGAFLVCRNKTLKQTALSAGAVFDPAFFLYKEDIELCLRLRKKGWQIVYLPEILVHHCRGWQSDRKAMPARLRLIAARNEVLLYHRHPSPYILWALLKYAAVRWLKV
jgi:N-acetylglucosaminyl-diphospho-decaprenol L-rhamnosyltransferase